MCGLVGMVAERDVAADIYDALTMLQHRGQDAAGIMTCQDGKLMQRKGEGLVRDVFRASHMAHWGSLASVTLGIRLKGVPAQRWRSRFM